MEMMPEDAIQESRKRLRENQGAMTINASATGSFVSATGGSSPEEYPKAAPTKWSGPKLPLKSPVSPVMGKLSSPSVPQRVAASTRTFPTSPAAGTAPRVVPPGKSSQQKLSAPPRTPSTIAPKTPTASGSPPSFDAKVYANRFRPLIVKALLKDGPQAAVEAERIGATIAEEVVKASPKDAPDRAMLLVTNFGDPANSWLRVKILSGEISPEKAAMLTESELRHPDTIKLQEKIIEEKQRDVDQDELRKAKALPTYMFKCRKCRGPCSVYQMQTRGGDEPMTNFLTCTKCGYQFKC